MRVDLLPPNSTPLEQKLSAACQPGILDLGDAAIRGRKFDPPDNWLDHLIYEYALGELSPWISDKRRLIAEGVTWTRLRGTPAALHMAFAWIGETAKIEEETPGRAQDIDARGIEGDTPTRHFAEYQLAPEAIPDAATLCQLVRLAHLSQPVRSRLARVYHGHDVRRLVLDEGRLNEHLLSADSGVRPTPEQLSCLPWAADDGRFVPPLLSFRAHYAAHLVLDEPLIECVITLTIARRITSWEADIPILDDLPEPREIETGITTQGQTAAHSIYGGQVWTGINWHVAGSWNDTRTIVSGGNP